MRECVQRKKVLSNPNFTIVNDNLMGQLSYMYKVGVGASSYL